MFLSICLRKTHLSGQTYSMLLEILKIRSCCWTCNEALNCLPSIRFRDLLEGKTTHLAHTLSCAALNQAEELSFPLITFEQNCYILILHSFQILILHSLYIRFLNPPLLLLPFSTQWRTTGPHLNTDGTSQRSVLTLCEVPHGHQKGYSAYR